MLCLVKRQPPSKGPVGRSLWKTFKLKNTLGRWLSFYQVLLVTLSFGDFQLGPQAVSGNSNPPPGATIFASISRCSRTMKARKSCSIDRYPFQQRKSLWVQPLVNLCISNRSNYISLELSSIRAQQSKTGVAQ